MAAADADDMELTSSPARRVGSTGWRRDLARVARSLIEAGWLTALAVIPMVVNPYSRQIFEPDKTAVFTVIAAVMVVAWLLGIVLGVGRAPVGQPGDTVRRRAAGWTGLVAVSIVVSSSLSIDSHRSWIGSYVRRQGAMTELLLLVFFLLVAGYLVSRHQWLRAAAVMVVTSVPICVYTLFQRFGFDPVPWDYALRVGATAGNPVFLGAYLALLPPVTLVLVIEQFRQAEREGWSSTRLGLLVYALALQVAALLLTESRGPVLAMAAGLAFMALTATRVAESRLPNRRLLMRRLRWTVVALGLVASAGLAGLGTAGGAPGEAPVVGRLATALSPEAKTTKIRIATWQGAADRLVHPMAPFGGLRPWVGHGPETFSLAFLGVAAGKWTRLEGQNRIPDRAHNEIWELAVTRGAFGLVSWLALFGYLAVVGLRDLGLLPDRARAVALAAWVFGGAGGAAVISLALDRAELLGPGIGCGLAAGLIAFSAFVPQPVGRPDELPLWRQLAALALLTSCLVHWIEIQVGFGLTLTRVVFFALAGALVGLSRNQTAGDKNEPLASPRRTAVDLGLALAAALTCLGFALSSSAAGRNSPAMLLLGSLVTSAPAPAVTPLLSAILGALAVGWALVSRPTRNGPSRGAAWFLGGNALLPALGVMALIHWQAVRGSAGAVDPAAAAESGIMSFRLLVLAVLVLLAAMAFFLTEPSDRREPRSPIWVRGSAVALLVGVLAASGDRFALDRIEADTFAKHGLAWLQIGAAEVGHDLLARASSLDPGEAVYWQERGRLDLESAMDMPAAERLLDDAARSLERATQLAPLDADCWANLGMARLMIAAHDNRDREGLEAADRAYTRALDLRPEWPQVLVQQAGVAALLGDDALAAARLAEAQRISGGGPPAPRAQPQQP